MKYLVFSPAIICILYISCISPNKKPYYKTTHKFINLVSANDKVAVKQMLRDGMQKRDSFALMWDIYKMSEYFKKNGVPADTKWSIQYDTLNDFLKYTNVVIPLSNNDISGNNSSYLKLEFDYTGKYLPDSIISGYDFHITHDLK